MDWDLMIPIVIIIIIVVMAAPFIIWLVTFFMRRKDQLIERPIDVHEMIYHKRKKAAKHNMRKFRLKRLVCLGDDDYPSIDYGKIVGLIVSKDVAEVFVKTRKLSPIKWCIIPLELERDPFGRNLRVYCRGFSPIANYFRPVWSRATSVELRETFEDTIDTFVYFIVTQEKNDELHEWNVNAVNNAINAKRNIPEAFYDRDEHMRSGAGGQDRANEETPT